jgi:hypothetical protein
MSARPTPTDPRIQAWLRAQAAAAPALPPTPSPARPSVAAASRALASTPQASPSLLQRAQPSLSQQPVMAENEEFESFLDLIDDFCAEMQRASRAPLTSSQLQKFETRWITLDLEYSEMKGLLSQADQKEALESLRSAKSQLDRMKPSQVGQRQLAAAASPLRLAPQPHAAAASPAAAAAAAAPLRRPAPQAPVFKSSMEQSPEQFKQNIADFKSDVQLAVDEGVNVPIVIQRFTRYSAELPQNRACFSLTDYTLMQGELSVLLPAITSLKSAQAPKPQPQAAAAAAASPSRPPLPQRPAPRAAVPVLRAEDVLMQKLQKEEAELVQLERSIGEFINSGQSRIQAGFDLRALTGLIATMNARSRDVLQKLRIAQEEPRLHGLMEKLSGFHDKLVASYNENYVRKLLQTAPKLEYQFPNQYAVAEAAGNSDLRSVCTSLAGSFLEAFLVGLVNIDDVDHLRRDLAFEWMQLSGAAKFSESLKERRAKGDVQGTHFAFDEVSHRFHRLKIDKGAEKLRTPDSVQDFKEILGDVLRGNQSRYGCVLTVAGETVSLAIKRDANQVKIFYFDSHKGTVHSFNGIEEGAHYLASAYPYQILSPSEALDRRAEHTHIGYFIVSKAQLQQQQQQAAAAAAAAAAPRQEREVPERKQQ